MNYLSNRESRMKQQHRRRGVQVHMRGVESFMLAYGVRPDQRTWIPLFSLCCFHHKKDSDASRSKCQAHTVECYPHL